VNDLGLQQAAERAHLETRPSFERWVALTRRFFGR
jgi:hypothetical protein